MQSQLIPILASAARTATGAAAIDQAPSLFTEANIYVDVTAVSGTTPSMTVTYQTSPDGVTWYDNTAGSAITTSSRQLIKVPANLGVYGRLSYVISGTTPSFTFSAGFEGKKTY